MSKHTIVTSEHLNALYIDGILAKSGRPSEVHGETLARQYRNSNFYEMDEDVFDDFLGGADYPTKLRDVPIERMRRI